MKYSIKSEAGGTTLALRGSFGAELETVLPEIERQLGSGPVVFVLDKVEHINSVGIGAWHNFISRLGKTRKLTFRDCSTSYMEYVRLLQKLKAAGTIESYYAPMMCDGCEREAEVLRKGESVDPIETPCKHCGGKMSTITE